MIVARLFLIGLLSCVHAAAAPAAAPSDIYRSVLRIEAATQVPDYETPWNSGRFSGGIGSGFLIGKNQILTNAHVVSNARRIMVTVHDHPAKLPARVQFIAHDCDLAILAVEDPSAFATFPVFEFGDVPALESQVRVIGYPIGGDRLSVTRGVVSRIDFQPYSHSRADSHLAVQIDAAINPGNSGGPVIQDGKAVGVAFQGLRQADNTGYMIPTPVIRRFLKDIDDGHYDQYVDLGIAHFPLHNPAMRRILKLPDNDRGVLVTNVSPTSSSDGVLLPGDVLLAIDGHPVDCDGSVTIAGENMDLNEIVERKFAGDQVTLQIQRAGKLSDATLTLKTLDPARMYALTYEKQPRYLVFAGLVFQPLDTNLFASSRFTNLTLRRMYADYLSKGLFLKRRDIVVLTRIESDPVTSQLDGFSGFAVQKINGQDVRDLKHADQLLHPPQPPEFHVIELFGASRPIVIASAQVKAANDRVARNAGIHQLSQLKE